MSGNFLYYLHTSPTLVLLVPPSLLKGFPQYSTTPSQADVAVFNTVSKTPEPAKYPHAARWYKHIASFQEEFSTLPGDTSAPASTYGPETAPAAATPAAAPASEDDDEIDLFGSSDEEDDEEKEALTKRRLEEYAAKKVNLLP